MFAQVQFDYSIIFHGNRTLRIKARRENGFNSEKDHISETINFQNPNNIIAEFLKKNMGQRVAYINKTNKNVWDHRGRAIVLVHERSHIDIPTGM